MYNCFRPLVRLTLLVLAGCLIPARAGVIQGVVINAVSSEFLSGNDQRRATNLVNGCGLFGEYHTATAAGSMWLTSPSSPGSVVSQASVTFDLGAVHTINRMKVWNYNEVQSGANVLTRRGIKACDILVAGEDQVFTTNVANQTFARATGTFNNQYDVVNMGGISARYVRINCRTNYSTTENDFRVGLSKVLFLEEPRHCWRKPRHAILQATVSRSSFRKRCRLHLRRHSLIIPSLVEQTSSLFCLPR